ncbi:SLAP domain-containing protein [Companilactobacillus zhongbaensis]|uniref:SLAP domain-containing protein n=1 Tax=Companilactobacillus zhongbaensis TaxID=2486009 RepID=UPI000F79519E|nr:SLAP domain-containing protein [Companilactobacillus zhongbaensis]
MKKKILISTLLCGMVLGSVATPSIVLAAENLREESTKKRKLTLHFTADFGAPKSVTITTTTGQFLDLKKFLPKGYFLADDQDQSIKITEKTDAITIKLAAKTRYDMIQFMGAKGVSMRSILKHTGEMITIKDYEKYVPKGYVVDTNRQTTFVSGNNNWGETFYVYLKPAPVVTQVEKEIKFVTDDGVDLEGFSAVFNVNGQLVVDPSKIPAGYEIEQRFITVTDDGERVIEIKLFKTFKNLIQFVTPDGEIVATTEITGRPGHEVIVQAPEGYEYPDTSFKLFTILSENTTQKVLVTSLSDPPTDEDIAPIPDNTKPEPGSGAEDSDSSLEEKPEENTSQKPDQPTEHPEEKPGENTSGSQGPATDQGNEIEVKPDDQENGVEPDDDQQGGAATDNNQQTGSKPDNDHQAGSGLHGQEKPSVDPGNDLNETSSADSTDRPGQPNRPEQPGQKTIITVPGEDTGSTNDVTATPSKVEPIKGQVMTHGQHVRLFDQMGRELNYALNSNTDWRIDQKMTLGGQTYYRVATNAWVKAGDVLEYERAEQVVNTGDNLRSLYDSKGKSSSHRSLAQNTEWFVDKAATINGKTYYRVSSDEWVLADELK